MTQASAAALAVVIVNFNTGAWLTRCLRSLEDCRGDLATDIVVIDNDSHDGSAEAAIAAVPGARLVRNDTNRYLSPAWNQGAALTDAPYLLFLNPDTEWFHGTLADLVAVARAHPTARASSGRWCATPTAPSMRADAGSRASSTPWDTRSSRWCARTTHSRGAITWTVGTARPSGRSTGSAAPAC